MKIVNDRRRFSKKKVYLMLLEFYKYWRHQISRFTKLYEIELYDLLEKSRIVYYFNDDAPNMLLFNEKLYFLFFLLTQYIQ